MIPGKPEEAPLKAEESPEPSTSGCFSRLTHLLSLKLPEGKENAPPENPRSSNHYGPTLVIHGGAGLIKRTSMTPELEKEYRAALEQALRTGWKALMAGTSMDAVVAAVEVMEDSPLFNAGKGSVFTITGKNELEASVMDGSNGTAGACTLLHHVKNPIRLALAIQEDSAARHLFMGGAAAEEYASSKGLTLVDPSYFFTERRWKQHLENPDPTLHDKSNLPKGTVGAVAVDRFGNLATATSTGGFNNKMDGRIGDTPIIGAGTWAENGVCACSGTGNGEIFIRYSVCHDIAARIKYLGESVQEASAKVVEHMGSVGGSGGVIVVSPDGEVAFPFNSEGMFRGYIRSDETPHISIYRD
ncbi:uncharacterized protein VTP21DRAFT_4571 [Calcarisporiella thermophila]|uniref:uncharacterized protein n=1 Tax=Calcarisporiella thermophila TaxID=911321 RepID=UPI003744A590